MGWKQAQREGEDQCCACKWFGTYTPCKCKIVYIYIYIYMIVHGYVKQYKYKKYKKCYFINNSIIHLFWEKMNQADKGKKSALPYNKDP
jgi:hypothetical protein